MREVAELPDRTSPADAPDMMMVTADELAGIVCAALPRPAVDEGTALPYDVTVGAVTFRKGVSLSTLIKAAERWYAAAVDNQPPLSNGAAASLQPPEIAAVLTSGLCSDCPPVGYPTDKTRCLPCPRRSAALAAAQEGSR